MDANNGPERSVLQKLKEKYRRRGKIKQVARTPHGTRIMLSVTNCNQSSSQSNNFTLYKRKIANLLANNTDLAKSLETLRLEYARMEQENAAYQRRLNYIPVVGAKLVDVSANLSLAASLISETVNMIVGVKRIISNESYTLDTVLTENSSAKSDQMDYFGLTKTPEDQLLTEPSTSSQNNVWQPRQQRHLDMSTINEVSLSEDTRNILGHATATYNLANLQELDDPETPAEVEARCAAIIAEAKQATSTPENKEPENEDELVTPKIPVLVYHDFFSSNIPKIMARHLPYKKNSEPSEEAMSKNLDKMSEDAEDEVEEPIVNNEVESFVNKRRGLSKTGKTYEKPSGKTNDPGTARYTDLKRPANNYEGNEGVTTDPTDHDAIIADDPSPQNANHSLGRKTFVIQPSISDSEPATKSTASTLKNMKPNSKKMPLKKSRRDTYLVLKNDENQANVEAAAVSSMVNLSRIERKLGNSVKDIENIRDRVMSNRQVSADAVVKDKKDKDINRGKGSSTSSPSIAPILKETHVSVNSLEIPASEVKAATDVQTSPSVKTESEPDSAVLNSADMPLIEAIPLLADESFLPLASECDANPPVLVSHSKKKSKYIVNEQENAKPDTAIASIEPVPNVSKIQSSKEADQEPIENSIANTYPVSVKKRKGRPSKKPNKLVSDSQENGDKENNEESSETKKIKEKTSGKKQKKTTASRSCKKNAKDEASVPTRKTSRQEALTNKGKPISQLNSPPTELLFDTLASTARKRKAVIYDIFDDGSNVASPCEVEAVRNSNDQQDESLSMSSENRNIPFSLLKASENIPYFKDNDSTQSRKKLKVEARSENNSFVNAVESSSTVDRLIQNDECPQTRMTSIKKETVETTKANKKGSSAKGKKRIAGAAENKKVAKQPKAKRNIAEKENEMARPSLADFHTPDEKVAVLKPAKKQNRLPKSPLKPLNVKEESISKHFNAEENRVNRNSLQGRDLNPFVEVNDYLIPVKENLGRAFMRSSFELNSGGKTLKIMSPGNISIDLVVPESIRKSIEAQSSSTPKAIKNSIGSCSNSVMEQTVMEQSRVSNSLAIMDTAPRRKRQTMSYREAPLRGKLRRP